ncbi:MAG: sulfatase [Proteobacteria bacterium]|nr:sulfatase [Pseudomonadota bacterium]MBU1715635.1 sulfatase [Pseudomonadota bacterium]
MRPINYNFSVSLLLIFLYLSSPKFCHGSTVEGLSPEEMPNIVFIWIDTLRADSLGCYGYQRDTSPNIDQLAKESTLFMNNFTPHTVTLSSFMSIITGLYPFSHGVLHIAKDILSPKIKTLAEILQMYGFATSWYGPNDPHLDNKVGFGRGFDYIDNFDNDLAVGRSKVLRAIERNKDQKFFLNFHSYHVHSPYIPSEKYIYQFTKHKDVGVLESFDAIEKATVEVIRQGVFNYQKYPYEILGPELLKEMAEADLFAHDYKITAVKIRRYLQRKNLEYKYDEIANKVYESRINPDNKENIAYLKALYDAGILEFDTEVIGPVINKLKELDLYDNTMIIICADHGEEFGEHGSSGHGMSLYQEVTWVPLIIKTAGRKEGSKIEELSQTVDIMPTILGLLKIKPPYHNQGIDFTPLINQTGDFTPRKYVYGQMPYFKAIRTKEWKLHVFHSFLAIPWLSESVRTTIFGKRELFNTENDPDEQNDRYAKEPKVRDELTTELEQWGKSLKNYQDTDYSFQPNIDKKTKDKIKKTGYW